MVGSRPAPVCRRWWVRNLTSGNGAVRLPEPDKREQDVPQIYNNTDWAVVHDLLVLYQVEYVYIGSLERSNYSEEGLAKFAQYMDVAYQNNSVVIYQWQPGSEQ